MTKHFAFGLSLESNGLPPGAGMPLASPSPWSSREAARRRREDGHYSRVGIWAASLVLSVLAWYWLIRVALDLVHLIARQLA
jgi:hypothetical protein